MATANRTPGLRAVLCLRVLLSALVACVAVTAMPSWAKLNGPWQVVGGVIRPGSPCLKGVFTFVPGTYQYPFDPIHVEDLTIYNATFSVTASCESSTPVVESTLVLALNILYWNSGTNSWTSCAQPLPSGALSTTVAYNASSVSQYASGVGAGVCPHGTWVVAQLIGWTWDPTAGPISGTIYSTPDYYW